MMTGPEDDGTGDGAGDRVAASDGPRRIEVAYVSRAHGVRGEVLAVPFVTGSTSLEEVDGAWIGGQYLAIERARPVPDGYLLVLAGVRDRDRAHALRGKTVELDRDALDLDDDEVLLADLVGCRVVTADGVAWGEVAAIEVGPQDRLVIRDLDAKVERLLPVVDEFLADIDLEARVITVTPPDGIPVDPL